MPRTKQDVLFSLTVADLKRLLATKERTVALEEKKARLESELASVDAQLAKLGSGVAPARRGRKPARKARRRGRPAVRKAVRRRVTKKAAGRRPRSGATVQDVVVGLIRENGKPMAFQDILGAIQKRKLVKTKSKDFSNVLRRTLSTSNAVKRVGRGVYAVKG